MRNDVWIRAGAFALAAALAGCGGKEGEDAGKQEAAIRTPAQREAPKTPRKSSPGAEAPTPAPEVATAADPKAALRFDMTQDGEAQTAETFETWMDERGVRVAEGADAEAGPDETTAAGTKASDTSEAGTD